MDNQRLHYLQALGIQTWQVKQPVSMPTASPCQNQAIEWENLRKLVASCTACGLDKTRTQTVFGVGNQQAKLMIIGEAPGMNEDLQGEPFVGRAGQLLNAMLHSIGFDRNSVYIANILKCRPPNNRDPLPEEASLCSPFLMQQIALVKPKLLLAVGRIAAQYLLNSKIAVSQLRGKLHQYGHTPLLVTYHPAYLLRSPKEKSKAYVDLQMVHRTLETL
jgi:uracil-DNA glycosylase